MWDSNNLGISLDVPRRSAFSATPRALATIQHDGGFTETGVRSWGPWSKAIEAHETLTGRRAPSPWKPKVRNVEGPCTVNESFFEWLMVLPEGYLTDHFDPDTEDNKVIALCGNGVVPIQAEAALTRLLQDIGNLEHLPTE